MLDIKLYTEEIIYKNIITTSNEENHITKSIHTPHHQRLNLFARILIKSIRCEQFSKNDYKILPKRFIASKHSQIPMLYISDTLNLFELMHSCKPKLTMSEGD